MSDICYFENNIKLYDCDVDTINNLLKQLSPSTKKVTLKGLREVMANGFIFFAVNFATNPEGKIVGMATLTKAYKPTAFFGTTWKTLWLTKNTADRESERA
jgi:hypothetical protein